MRLDKRYRIYYRFLSMVLIFVMVSTLLLPANNVSAATTPRFTTTSKDILEGDTYAISIKNKIAGAKYTWKSTDKSIAKVSQKGIVTGLKKGTAIISCSITSKQKNYTLKCNITVRRPATEVLISNKIDYIKLGESYDLNRTLKPSGANEITSWNSSDPNIISINKNGLMTAKSLGMATITVSTKHSSDSITIYVVKQDKIEITKKDVVDGVVTISNKSCGEFIISNSVGNAKIILNKVTIGGTLVMESGSYTVTTNDCMINKVKAVDTAIKSFALGEEKVDVPSLIAGSGSIIVTIDSECNISVKQADGAIIQSFSVITKKDGTIEIALEGFKGDLVIDSQSQAAISIATTACDISSATVKNATEGQSITLADANAGTDQASSIGTVHMSANAALKVDVKTEEVVIGKEASQAEVTILQTVTNLTVEGTNTNINLQTGAQVTNVTAHGDNTRLSLSEGATIQKVSAYGDSTAIEGTGKVAEAVVTGNNIVINTEVAKVQVAIGTSNVVVNGVEVKEEEKVVITTPTPTPIPTQKVTPTPKASVTPKPSISPTPTLSPTLTPSPTTAPPYVPPIIIPPTPTTTPTVMPTSAPTATPTKAPTPTPTTTPIATPTSTPTVTPTKAPTPTATPTEKPTEGEKLLVYKEQLNDLNIATSSLVDTQNEANRTAVYECFTELISTLISFDDIDTTIPEVFVSKDSYYLYDYAEYAQILITRGQNYGLPIRLYYEAATTGTQTYTMAVAAANKLAHMIYRINTERHIFIDDVEAVFTSLYKSPAEFRIVMNQLLVDVEEYEPFTEDMAEYYQKGMQDFVTYDPIMNDYYTATHLSYFKALDCFLRLNSYYGQMKNNYTLYPQYQTLLDNLIDALPPITPIYEEGHYIGADYDLGTSKEGVIAAIEAIIESIDPATIWGDSTITLTVRGKYEELIIKEIIRKLYTTETYESGYYEKLNYYRMNRAELTEHPNCFIIYDAVVAVVCCVKDVPEWNIQYLSMYDSKVKNIIAAAKADKEEELYEATVELFQAKLSESEDTKREWKEYLLPFREDGTPNIDKTYFLQFIKEKLEPNTDQDEEGNPVNSTLYLYDQLKENATGEDLDAAIYRIKDAVYECELELKEKYDNTFGMLNDLMKALVENQPNDAYEALSNICDFMNAQYSDQYTFTLRGDKYAPIYHKMLRMNMLEWDCDFNQFYHMFVDDQTYNRYIAELEINALWNVSWWLQEGADSQDWLNEECSNYDKWQPIMDNIYTFRYDENASDEAKLQAMKSIFQLVGQDEEIVSHFWDLKAPENYEPKLERVWDYWAALSLRIEDETMYYDEESDSSWPLYGLRRYDLSITGGSLPDFGTVEQACQEILYSVIHVDQLYTLNRLIDAIKAENASEAYAALKEIYTFFDDVLESDVWLVEEKLDECYMQDLKNIYQNNDENNWFYQYAQFYDRNEVDQLSIRLEEMIDGSVHYISGNLLTEYTYETITKRSIEVNARRSDLDALLDTVYGDCSEFYTILDQLIKDANLELYGLEPFQLMEKYAIEIQNALAYQLEHERFEDGNISWVNYYYHNKLTLGKKEISVIYESLNLILNVTWSIQEENEHGLNVYRPLIEAVFTAIATNDEAGVLEALKAIYSTKIEEGALDWLDYAKPVDDVGNSLINISYCMEQITNCLLDPNNDIYQYANHPDPVFQDAQNVLYHLKDIVGESQLSGKVGWINLIDTLLYSTEEGEWSNAANELVGKVLSDPELSSWFSTLDLSDLTVKNELIQSYLQNIAINKADSNLYEDGENTWQNSMYLYDQMRVAEKSPDIGFINRITGDLMFLLIETNRSLEMFHMVNNLYSAVLAKDPINTYQAMATINGFINEVNPAEAGIMRDYSYNVAYFHILYDMIHSSDPNNQLYCYLLNYQGNVDQAYSFELRQIIQDTIYTVQWLTQDKTDSKQMVDEAYVTYLSWNNIKQRVDAVIQDSLQDQTSAVAKLNELIICVKNEAVRLAIFDEITLGKLAVNEAYFYEIADAILACLNDPLSASRQYKDLISLGRYPSYDQIMEVCREIGQILISYTE